MKISNLKTFLVLAATASIISACGNQDNLVMPADTLANNTTEVNAQAAKKATPQKNYIPLQPGEGEQYDFRWMIYCGRDQNSIATTKTKFLSFMNAHVTTSDIARYVITDPVQYYSGKHSNGGGYFLEIKLYGVKDSKLIKKTISKDLEKFLGYDKYTADSGAFALYDEDSFIGPGIFFRW